MQNRQELKINNIIKNYLKWGFYLITYRKNNLIQLFCDNYQYTHLIALRFEAN